jgi:hypothetical protein
MIQRWNYSLASVYLIHVMNGRYTMICVQCHLQKYLHGSKKAWIMHGKDGLWDTWIGDQIQVFPTLPPGANIRVPSWPPPFTIRGGHGVVAVWKINLSRGQLKCKKGFCWLDLALATSAGDALLAKLPVSSFQNPKLCVFRLVWVFPSAIYLLAILFLLVLRLLARITLVVWLIVLHKIVNNCWRWCIGR